ncbi:MAG: hypothetical protein ACRERX_00185 [Pseudomonas sp.]
MPTRTTKVVLAPPLIYLIFIAIAAALSFAWPVSLTDNHWTRYAGWGLIDAGLLLVLWAALAMARHKTTSNPYKKPQRPLTSLTQPHLTLGSPWFTAALRCSTAYGPGCCCRHGSCA